MLWWSLQQLKSSNPDVRIKAIRDLESAKSKKAVPSLIKILRDQNPQVRLAAIKALGTIAHPASAGSLVTSLNQIPQNEKSGAAAECEAIAKALACVGSPAVKPLIGALGLEAGDARRWAAHALGMIRDPQAVEPLIGKLEDNRSGVRKAAALALGEIGDLRAIKPLIVATASRDLETRRAAVEALGLTKSEEGINAILKAMEDPSEFVQLAAVNSLVRIGGLSAAACLRSAMSGTRKSVCDAAERALKSMSITPSNAEERAELAVILGDFESASREGQAAVPVLINALRSKDPQMRVKAAEMLALLPSPEAVQPLLVALKDHHAQVQASAARALATIGPGACAGLEELLSYYDVSAVCLAANALGEIGLPDSVQPLADLICTNASIPGEYPDLFDAVRCSAEALGKILSKSAAEITLENLERIAALPETVCLQGLSPNKLDCSGLRTQAAGELLQRRGS